MHVPSASVGLSAAFLGDAAVTTAGSSDNNGLIFGALIGIVVAGVAAYFNFLSSKRQHDNDSERTDRDRLVTLETNNIEVFRRLGNIEDMLRRKDEKR